MNASMEDVTRNRHPQDLIRHIQNHEEKTFECDFCEKKFAEKGY